MRMLLPTGHTPRGLYAALRAHAADGSLPSEHVTVLGLDEYLGLGSDDARSFHADLDRELAGIPIGRREALDGAAADPDAEAARYEAVLDAAPVDLAVLGLGRDAHVAFNEPGSRPGDGVRRIALDPSTVAAAAANFGGAQRVPREALTVGPRTLLLGVKARVSVVTSVWHCARRTSSPPIAPLGWSSGWSPRAPCAARRTCWPRSWAALPVWPASAGRRWTPSGCRRDRGGSAR